MAVRSARQRRHHPYDTPFRHQSESRSAPATDRTGAMIVAALSCAVAAGAAWAAVSHLLGG